MAAQQLNAKKWMINNAAVLSLSIDMSGGSRKFTFLMRLRIQGQWNVTQSDLW